MRNFAAIVLAAGKGTRMKSRMPKVLHPICGRPMLHYPLNVLKGLRPEKVVVVVGHGSEEVMEIFRDKDLSFAIQKPQLGTAHAVRCGFEEHLRGFKGDLLIISGDTPLITKQTVKGLFRLHRRGSPDTVLSLVTALVDDPKGYGRVVRDSNGAVLRIVEERDATKGERRIKEINAGMYLVDSAFLSKAIGRVSKRNAQKEFYLTDLIVLARGMNKKVSALTHLDPEEVMGVNSRGELARATGVMRTRILDALMERGVTIVDPERTYIDHGVKVGSDTTVYPGVHLLGETTIGPGVTIEEGARIVDSSVGSGTVVRSYSVVEGSSIGRDASIGPFARLRPRNTIGNRVRIGNFVEVKNSKIGNGSKANHLSYIGDSDVGKDVNIGAGTITCNYDGIRKHRTVIEDGVFVGSDTQLVAPVRIGRRAYIGSGSTITKDVPPESLAISRVEQKVVEGWVKKRFSGKKKGY